MINPILFLVPLALFFARVQCVQLYSSKSHLCCRGSLYPIPKKVEHRADLKHYCCGSTLVEYSEYANFNVPLCCQDILYANANLFEQACCGTTMYNLSTHACLNQRDLISLLAENPFERVACGKYQDNVTFYHQFRQLCCSGVVHPKVHDVQCCGESVYNQTSSLCCDGHAVELEKPREKELPWATGNNYYMEWECCGKLVYNSTEQQCCNNKIVDKPEPTRYKYQCCGHELSTDRNTICVGDHWEVRKDPKGSYRVCGGQLYDERWRRGTQKVCFNDTVIELGYGEGVCAGDGKAVKYNVLDKSIVCCPSQIVYLSEEDKTNNRSSCCDESLKYEPQSEMQLPGMPV